MNPKLAVLFALMALAAFGLVACGDDDDEGATEAVETTEQTDTGGDTGGDSGGGSTLAVSADPGGQLAYEQTELEAGAGPVTIELTNDASVPHDVRVEGPEGDLGGTEQITEDVAEVTIDLEAGDYTFYCSVPGHREAGMEGPLTVK